MRNLDHDRRARESKRIKGNYRRRFVSRAMQDQAQTRFQVCGRTMSFPKC
jgi:hypothetical protein